MKSLLRLIILVLFFGGWALAAASLYVVRTPQKLIVVPKNRLAFQQTYTDTRNWTLSDVAAHPDLVNRLIEADKSATLAHVTGSSDSAEVTKVLQDTLKNGPPEHTPSATQPRKPPASQSPQRAPVRLNAASASPDRAYLN